MELECFNHKYLNLIIYTDKLNLSEDAVIDNLGGYVDIFENSFYIKTAHKVYYIHGHVKNLGDTHQFTSEDKGDPKFITVKELDSLKDKKNLKFIQKIRLEKDNKVVKNIIDIYFDTKNFEIEYQRCHKSLNNTTKW